MTGLAVEGLSVCYGAVHALGPLGFTLEPGRTCAVVGPSGCGKSTLLHALSGILRGQAGRLLLGGESIDPRRHVIGFMPQDFGMPPWYTVRRSCMLPLTVRRIHADAPARARLDTLASRLGITELMDRYPNELSGGQLQRAAAARAFMLRPDLLLMDEPFSSLDALTRERAQALFLELWKSFGATTVLTTHSIEEAALLGSRILVLSPRPGTVIRIVENPSFGMEGAREKKEFRTVTSYIRNIIDKHWSGAY